MFGTVFMVAVRSCGCVRFVVIVGFVGLLA